MALGGEQHQSDIWAHKTLDRLKADGLQPTPENYAVFYNYFSGLHAELISAIDAILKSAPVLTQAQCTDVYENFLGLHAQHRFLQKASEAVDSELKTVLGVIQAAAKGTDDYTKTLNNFSGKLVGTASLDQIRDAVNKVAQDTRVMAEQNIQLQSQLSQATEQLSDMRESLDRAHQESQIDQLTQVGNRKFFDRELARSMAESANTGIPLSVLMIDIDFFKKFNDNYGHLVGDQVLRLVAKTLVENLKGRDIIARYGGEEFVILLPQTTTPDAEKVANQLRASLGTKQLKKRSTNETLGVITISIGATQYTKDEDVESFIGRADGALYKAKQTGRNKVVCADINSAN